MDEHGGLVLSETQQRALRSVVAAEPVPGSPLPRRRILESVATLIPCDGIGVAIADDGGHLLDCVDLARSHLGDLGRSARRAPLPLGVRRASQDPVGMQRFLGDGVVDTLLLGCRNGPDLVVELALQRRATSFASLDVALLHLIEPALARIFREPAAPHLPTHLTVQERRILQLVATGQSNPEIAARLCIAPSTVRKHLEHVFAKLGVTNRWAAAAAFTTRQATAPGREPAVARYA